MGFLLFALVFGITLAAPISRLWFNKYHSYKSHVDYLHHLASGHPSMATVFTAGKSFEQRDIWGIHIFGKSGPGNKPAVVFFGTIHAREWITAMVTEYIAYNLLEQYRFDSDIKHAMDSFDFYIFPLVNPDGIYLHHPTSPLCSALANPPQDLFTAKPKTACGARTDRGRTALPASAAISTVIGMPTGTRKAARPPLPAAVPTRACNLSMPPRREPSQ